MSHDATSIASPHRLGFESAGMLMSPDEFDAISECDESYRYELVHGVLVVNPVPSEAEADPNEELGYLFRRFKEDHPQGHVLDLTLAERYVELPGSRRRADRLAWAGLGRRPDPRIDVPALVIEFVSWGRRNGLRDFVEKQREYIALGVKEYWVIDRFRRTMTVFYQPGQGAERTVGEHETYTTALLPGFELPLARLFDVADRWSD